MKTGISIHWTAGGYLADWLDLKSYHAGVSWNGIHAISEKWNNYFSNEPQHTWNRNSSLIGIACCCMAGKITSKYWEIPPTKEQIEDLCLLAAEIAHLKNIKLENIKTHAEWALEDGYGPQSGDPQTKWDFALFEPGRATPETAKKCGNIFRGKIGWYMNEIRKGKKQPRDLHYKSMINGIEK